MPQRVRDTAGLPYHRRPRIRHRHIRHAELYALAALIAVDRQAARDMQQLTAMLGDGVAELLPDRTKCDAVDDRAVAGFQPPPHMRLSNLVGIDELMRRQRDHRLRIAAAEGAGAI